MADQAAYARDTAASNQIEPPPNRDSSASLAAPPRIRRRNRVIASCLECRRRKLKCDKQAPCTNCSKFRRDCLYIAPSLDSTSQQKIADIKEKMGHLEATLERDIARKPSNDQSPLDYIKTEATSDQDDIEEAEDEKDLEPDPFAALDQVYEDDADDEIMDLGVQLGKMRVSDRIGGFARPRMAEELSRYPDRGNLASQAAAFGGTGASMAMPTNWSLSDSPAVYLGPGPDYIAPASSFFFPTQLGRSMLNQYLPSRNFCDILMTQYWQAVHQIVPTVHKPTYEKKYLSFWDHIAAGTEPPASMQALMFAAIFTAAVSMPDTVCMQRLGVPKVTLVERLQSSTETSLSRANFLRTTKLDTMQAFVMYLIPLCRAEISRAHSALTGTAVRLAECMGLHRDGSLYGFSAVETHTRRLIWHQLCYLDLRTSEATGPRPQIRKDDFDTKLPLNLDETDFILSPQPVEDTSRWTDMTLCRMRIECTDFHRQLWVDMPRIDQKKIKLAAVLGKIQKFRADMDARYLPLFQGSTPKQIVALHLYRVVSTRPYIIVLHRYLSGASNPMPDRLRTILIEACLATNEHAIAFETRPETQPWAWYRGAIIQYHAAMLLLFELYHNPTTPNETRIWKTVDFIFELPPYMTKEQKLDTVIFALRDRLQVYQSMRKMRAQTLNDDTTKLALRKGFYGVGMSPETMQSQQEPTSYDFSAPMQMNPMQYNSPPIRPPSLSDGSQGFTTGTGTSPMDMAGQMGDVDWAEWDQFFPPDNTTDFGALPDLDWNLGSFSTFSGGYNQPSNNTQV